MLLVRLRFVRLLLFIHFLCLGILSAVQIIRITENKAGELSIALRAHTHIQTRDYVRPNLHLFEHF